ncbi:Kinesin-related motor protein, variant 2 [Xanthoria parietina]
MLQGYNCTIFAYGQTGTGKTYTMSGDMSETLGILSDAAGVIPRVLHSLFTKLEADETESSVKCSFIELYNEELRDLIAVDDTTKLKIYDDAQKKGHGATLVQGMEESYIKSAGAGIKLLQDGSHKRQVAATKCNDLSSRSHTVFTITVYIKRTAENGEDFISAGKLNLVDLAGSENIQRSGAENKRAAEAGLINKSLLTLGRVINALVERGSHIPYRESKLTRLLQDSLGGRTKTCIIATVSPAKSNLEETISTLDYAFRAKNIRNKPQVNQTLSKNTLLREFTAEIEKLKGELMATRHRNGVYLTAEGYDEIVQESESRRILSEEQKDKIETMEVNLRNKVQELFTLTNNFTTLKKDSDVTRQTLDDTKGLLEKTELVLADAKQNLTEETVLRKAHQSTEDQLNNVGGELISTLERTVNDVGGLHSKIRRKNDLEAQNLHEWHSSQRKVSDATKLVESKVEEFRTQQTQLVSVLSERTQSFVSEELQKLQSTREFLQGKVSVFEKSEHEVLQQTSSAKEDMHEVLEEIKVLREDVKRKVGEGLNGLSAAAGRISAEVINELDSFQNQLHTSYSSLGRDFKAIFEELVKHVNTQKAEADELRSQISTATRSAIRAEAAMSSHLESVLSEERAQAAEDRQNLLSQISLLVTKSGEAQDARWQSKVNEIKIEITSSRSDLESAESKYNDSMSVWSEKENLLVEEVVKSRESLKSRMKKDWTAVNERNTAIQTTTKSVHEETIRIVDAQMQDIATQMQALDDFVTRARSQNERHHSTHVSSLRSLASTVNDSYSSIGDHFTSSYDRVRDVGNDISDRSKILQDNLSPLSETVQRPLSSLRSTIINNLFKEYIPTGETPQKTQYRFPTTLPRTEPHDRLLTKIFPASHQSSSTSLIPPPSPSKSIVYTDLPDNPSTDPFAVAATSTSTSTPSKPTTGLRELDMNITNNNNNYRHSDPTLANNNKPAVDAPFNSTSMGPPPLKRQATMEGNSKLPTKLGQGKGVVRVEGRENLGAGRRLRSSPTG